MKRRLAAITCFFMRGATLMGTALCLYSGSLPAAGAKISDGACLECHRDPGLETIRGGRVTSLYVDTKALAKSVHKDIECTACHAEIEEIPHENGLAPAECTSCHGAQAGDYAQSIHGLRHAEGDADSPGCAGCHGTHDIKGVEDPGSRVFRTKIVEICTNCHADEQVVKRHGLPRPETIKAYAKSVHGRGLFEKGLAVSAVCVDCHGAHTVEPADDPRSPVNRENIPNLCGRCHPEIVATYRESIHGRAVSQGIREAPVCTDCHGEHTIAAPSDPASKVGPRNIPKTCAACHEEERIAGKYGLPMRRYSSYLESYHGVVNRYGEAAVANCASCHGVHDIRPSSDPVSSIHPNNLKRTCGACHPGVTEVLVRARVHVEARPESSKGMYYVRMFYTYFIGILMVCFLAYMTIDIYGSWRRGRGQ